MPAPVFLPHYSRKPGKYNSGNGSSDLSWDRICSARRETVGLKAKAPSGLLMASHETQREGRRMRRPSSLRSRVML